MPGSTSSPPSSSSPTCGHFPAASAPLARGASPTPWGWWRCRPLRCLRRRRHRRQRWHRTDRAVASAGSHLPAGTIVAGTASHPGLAINGAIALALVGGWEAAACADRAPPRGEEGHEPAERRRAAAIVREHGCDSLDPFAVREDKAFHFAAGGFVAYRVLRETAVVSGDPVGPAGCAPAVLESFVRFAEERGWHIVITAASERHLAACRQLGLRVLRIGDEAVVDPQAFSLEGRPIRKVRQSIARVRRHGWRVEVVDGCDVTSALERELGEVEAEWRSRQRRLIGFAMTLGRLAGAGELDGGVYVLGRDPDGRLRSFLRFASYRNGLSLDLMRRAGEEPNGLTEALVVAAIERAREGGLGAVSLNFAGFAHVMAADAALSRSQRLLRLVLRLFHGRFQLERLVRFNAKFLPCWQARYLVYDGLTYLPLSALRVLQAEAYLRLQTRLGGGSPSTERPAGSEGRPRPARSASGLPRPACLWATDAPPRAPSASTRRTVTPTGPSSTAGRATGRGRSPSICRRTAASSSGSDGNPTGG